MCSCRARSQPVRGQADCHFVGSRIVQSLLGDTMGFITLFRCPGLCLFQQSSKTPAVVGGTRKRKGADHDGVRGIAQDKEKKARAQARNCEHGKRKEHCQVLFVRPSMTLRPNP
jgi:hypothetical protein